MSKRHDSSAGPRKAVIRAGNPPGSQSTRYGAGRGQDSAKLGVFRFLNECLVAWPGISAVDGVGLVALRAIKRGEKFLEERFTDGDRISVNGKQISNLHPFIASFIAARFPTSGRKLKCHCSLANGNLSYAAFCYMFLNRSDSPNTKFVVKRDRQFLVATEDIPAGGEVFTDDYTLEMCQPEYYS
jgi:hypothetical protein